MLKINGIGLENFRVFKSKQWFDFAPITILTGTNSSGKSSLVNAMKLLSKNEINLKENEPNILGLNEIMNQEFDTEYILERYGSLQSFVSNDSEIQEFNFSFKNTCPNIDDEFELIFDVQIQDNKMKTGKVHSIKIKSINEDVVVFSVVEEKRKQEIDMLKQFQEEKMLSESVYISQINLTYFFKHFGKYIFNFFKDSKSVDELMEKHNIDIDDFSTYLDDFAEMVSDYSDRNGTFLNFNFIGQKKLKNEKKLKELIKHYYGKYDDKVLLTLQNDILNFLSKWKWNYSDLRFVSGHEFHPLGENQDFYEGNFPFGFSFQDFYYTYIKQTTEMIYKTKDDVFNIEKQNLTQEQKERKKQELAEKSIKDTFNDDSQSYSRFVEEVFIPLTIMIDKEQRNETIEFKPTKSEIFFYNKFIFEALSLLKYCLKNFKDVQFIDADRIETKRSFSVNANDNFSRQVKKLFKASKKDYDDSIGFINKWLSAFEIAEKISFDEERDTEFFKVYLTNKTGKKFLLADYGYGISQVLPIILYLIPQINYSNSDSEEIENILNIADGKSSAVRYLQKTIVIEEPENSLHPAFQSKLADMFVEAVKKFNIQLIIETHSEYLIRRLQYLTISTEGDLFSNDVIIYYFYHPDKIPPGEKQIKKISIQEDGSLTDDFGSGFFDEADKIAISIWNMNQSQKN